MTTSATYDTPFGSRSDHLSETPSDTPLGVPSGIVTDANSVTGIVEAAMSRTTDARLKQITTALVRHAHAFLHEVKLTPEEFEQGLAYFASIGQATNDNNNETVLLSDVLGISTLVTLLNSIDHTDRTPGALLGPFYRANSPVYPDGADIACAGSFGDPLFVRGRVIDAQQRPVPGAIIDVWQASPVGLYENQDPEQPDMNLRGRFRSDAAGSFNFRTVRPAGYPVPTDGPVGTLLAAQQRHPYRPAHVHFLVTAEGHETLISQVFADQAEYLDSDVVFGVLSRLVGEFKRHDDSDAPDGSGVSPYYTLDYTFVLVEGTPTYPTPPIK
jgi:protocatechuate 3,4-dioxygenase beta subunit